MTAAMPTSLSLVAFSKVRDAASSVLPAVISGLVILALWETTVRVFDIKPFLLPGPLAVIEAGIDESAIIRSASIRTLKAVLLGLGLGVSGGVAMAMLLSFLPRLSAPVLTFAIAVNSAPIIALAPISNNWFGITSLLSKAAVAAVMVFFPVLVNTTRGLLNVRQIEAELFHSYAATRRQTSRLLRFPSALPYLFSALKLGSTLAVIGVIVTEYFGGPTDALGVYIANKAALPKFADAWAGVAAASAAGLGLFAAVSGLERLAMPWHASVRGADS